MINIFFVTLFVGVLSLRPAWGEGVLLSNSPPGEAAGKVHVVHLRTGIIDVASEQDRLPLPTPAARRALLQQQPTSSLPPTQSTEWGPLARSQLWILTLGPTLHWQENEQHLIASPSLPYPQPHNFGDGQRHLMSALHNAGCAVVSFLPPAAWLLAVADEADPAPVLEAFDVRLAPYGPASLRVAPELAAILELLRQAGDAVAERIASGERLDDLLDEARKEQSGLLLGAMRAHMATRGAMKVGKGRVGENISEGVDGGAASGGGRMSSGRAVIGGPQEPRRVQVEVHFPHMESDDLAILSSVRPGPESEGEGDPFYHPAAAAAADWLEPLSAFSPPDCSPLLAPDFGSKELLLVSVCPMALEATVQWLAAAPQVTWVAPRMVTRLHNLVSGAIVQTGGGISSARIATSLSTHPFWAAGLTGTNQIVGCGDSGLDFGHCFFYDSSVDVRGNVQVDSNGMQFFNSTQHRKLRFYLALVQDMADSFGHGTHVSGTLVGSRCDKSDPTAEPLASGTGQAPGAKIAFMDLSRGNSDGVWTPGDLYYSYFNMTYREGARVHSDSWGSELTAYDSMSASLDRFTFFNQDFLSVFAAGNYGDKSSGSDRGTVTSPAVAKNCIAVGATLSLDPVNGYSRPGWVQMTNMTVFLDLAGGQRFVRSVRVVKAGFGTDIDTIGLSNSALAVASPETACASLANAGAVSGKVVLVQRGGCVFTEKARYAAAAGARAVIVYNNVKDSGYFPMSAPSDYVSNSINVAAGSVPLSTGLWLKSSVAGGVVTLQFSKVTQPDYPYFEDVAGYSSVGPTTDGRIKPDIVAPGTLRSANSSRTVPLFGRTPSCDSNNVLVAMSGTSMATPVVAGAALLVRQYFMDGFYPDGVRNPSRGFQPSGPLIKAVLLGGADHMMGVVANTGQSATPDSGMPLEDAPSYRQGFGRLSLLHSLPLANNPISSGWSLQVVDGASLRVGDRHQFCVRASGGPLRITLAWYDPPGEPAAARALVNNLDLQVRAAGRGLLLDYGNGVKDTVNTVEQVWYDDLPAGEVAITVSAEVVLPKYVQQPYALVVQGKFSGTLSKPSSSDTTSANTCAAQLAVIRDDLSTPPITNSKNLTFYFSNQDGNNPAGSAFQCRLIVEGSSNSGGWESCSFPSKSYSGVQDGRYSFQVRVSGEEVAAVRSVIVDTEPPIISLNSSLPNLITPADNTTFTFSATDNTSAVTYTCRVEYSNGPGNRKTVPYLRFGPRTAAAVDATGITLNSSFVGRAVSNSLSFPCGSPLELIGMSYGDYSLLVIAVDAALNRVEARLIWKIRYDPNTLYARVISGPVGLVPTRNLTYGVVGFNGSQAQSTPLDDLARQELLQPYEYTYAQQSPSGGNNRVLRDIGNSASWQPLRADNVTVNLAADGYFMVLVRPKNSTDPVTWGLATVQVDTTPPTVVITRAPSGFQSDPRVTIRFADDGTDDDTRAFFCRLMGNASAPPDPNTSEGVAPYAPCRDSATFNVTEGFWLFQVKGQDAAGNMGPPANAPFVTDLRPPSITTNLPSIVNVSKLEWNYTISDTGSELYNGSTNSSCSFRWLNLDNGGVTVDGDDTFLPVLQSPTPEEPCRRAPLRYTVQEGIYRWSVSAIDSAGLKTTMDIAVMVDLSKPSSSAAVSKRAVPSKFTVSVFSTDLPKVIKSGLVLQECKIDVTSAPPPSPPPPQPTPSPPDPSPPPPRSSPVSGSNSRIAAASPDAAGSNSSSGGSSGSRRILLQQSSGPGSGPRLYNISGNGTSITIQMGVWHVCDESPREGFTKLITYDGFSTGFYTFSVRARDAAGNQGDATKPMFFTVDATLPPDGSESVQVSRSDSGGSSNRTKKIVIGVVVLVGAIVLIISAVAIFIARRRYLRKYAAERSPQSQLPPGLAAAVAASHGGIAMQPVSHHASQPPPPSQPMAATLPYTNGMGNGYSNGGHVPTPPPPLPPPAVASGMPVVSTVPPTMPVGGAYYAPHPVGAGVVATGMPLAAPDPALVAVMAVSVEEAQRARAAEEAQRSRAAALAMEDEQRLRQAIAVSIEEDNLRRAKEASLAAAVQQSSDQAALEAAIAASLVTAEQDRQRLQQRSAPHTPRPPPPPPPQPSSSVQPSAPPSGPPDYGLI